MACRCPPWPRPAPSRLARKQQAAQSLLKLAVTVATIHPEMGVHLRLHLRLHLHLRLPAAASELEHGNQEGAKRHMAAAMHALAPATTRDGLTVQPVRWSPKPQFSIRPASCAPAAVPVAGLSSTTPISVRPFLVASNRRQCPASSVYPSLIPSAP